MGIGVSPRRRLVKSCGGRERGRVNRSLRAERQEGPDRPWTLISHLYKKKALAGQGVYRTLHHSSVPATMRASDRATERAGPGNVDTSSAKAQRPRGVIEHEGLGGASWVRLRGCPPCLSLSRPRPTSKAHIIHHNCVPSSLSSSILRWHPVPQTRSDQRLLNLPHFMGLSNRQALAPHTFG